MEVVSTARGKFGYVEFWSREENRISFFGIAYNEPLLLGWVDWLDESVTYIMH